MRPAFQPSSANTTLQPVGRPVARVNGAVLTDRDLLREMYAIFPYARQHNGSVPKAMEADIRNGAMKMIVFEELVYQEAERRKMTVAPARMQTRRSRFPQTVRQPGKISKNLLNTEFKGSQALLSEKIKRSLLIEDLLKLEVDDKSSHFRGAGESLLRQEPGPVSCSRIVRRSDDLHNSSRQRHARASERSAQAGGGCAAPGQGHQEL